jgi:hypothetical protein
MDATLFLDRNYSIRRKKMDEIEPGKNIREMGHIIKRKKKIYIVK